MNEQYYRVPNRTTEKWKAIHDTHDDANCLKLKENTKISEKLMIDSNNRILVGKNLLHPMVWSEVCQLLKETFARATTSEICEASITANLINAILLKII